MAENEVKKENYTLFAQNIVLAKGKKIFAKNKALSCLAKSDVFFKELTNLFNKLNLFEITPQKFKAAVEDLPDSTDKERLILCAEVYECYINVMAKNGYRIPFVKVSQKKVNPNLARNNDIKKRIEFLVGTFLPELEFGGKKTEDFDLEFSENIEYLKFSDIQNEGLYVVKQIKNAVNKGIASYSDFAVFVDKTEARQKFLDLMKAEEIPVMSSIYDENYENLKHKINIYEKISKICKDLCLEEFNSENFKNLSLTTNLNFVSKSQKEICLEQLDEILKSLAEEVFENSYTLDKISNLNEKSQKSFTESLFSSLAIIDENECERLVSELSAIKSFYASYGENNYAQAIESLLKRSFALFENTPVKEIAAGKIKSLNELQNLYDNILGETPDFAAFNEIMKWLPPDTQKDKNAVRLASICTDFKENESYKYVFVSGLTEKNFPAANPAYPFISEQTNKAFCEKLKAQNPHFDSFLQTDEKHFEQQFLALCSIMKSAADKIVFTTYTYETKKSVQPSVFFNSLTAKDEKNYKTVKDNEISAICDEKQKSAQEGFVKFDCEPQNEVVIAKDDVLKLNPSAISTFQGCPRKYFYKHLLNLKEKSNFSASYGSIVHAVFEVMNKIYISDFGKEKALELGEILFNAKNNIEKTLEAGFSRLYADLVCATDDLSLVEMKKNFENAIEDYDKMGYFCSSPVKAVCEQEFSFTLEELENVVFDGRIDAILTDEDGKTKIIDYKTGKNKINSLCYAISEAGVNFQPKTARSTANVESLQKSYDYQIPIYYLASQNCKNLEHFKGKIDELGLVYVRPKNRHDGCDKDFVKAEDIEFFKEKIVKNLKETVVDKIRNECEFKPSTSFGCEYCDYKFLCDEGGEDE